MPSSKYVAISSKGRLPSLSETNKSSQIAGGAVTLLLKNIVKNPITTGAGFNEPRTSNIMVGMITPQPSSKVTTGGELLNKLENLRFGKGKANRKESNIKFIF